MKNKNYRIVNLRTLAIILVVFGHSIIIYQNEWGLYVSDYNAPILNLIKKIIDLIQMPLFLSISGYLFYNSFEKRDLLNLFLNKFKRLIIPFVMTALLWLIPIRKLISFKSYLNRNVIDIFINDILLGANNGHLWYLPCLFCCFMITYLLYSTIKKINNNEIIQSILLIVFSYLAYYFFYLVPPVPGSKLIRSVMIWWIWFIFGFIFAKHADSIAIYISKYKYGIIILSILFLILYFNSFFPFKVILIIMILFSLIALVPSNTNDFIMKIDKNSFGIYLFHSPLVYITYTLFANCNPFIVVSINFLLFGSLAYVITNIMRNSPFKVIIGE